MVSLSAIIKHMYPTATFGPLGSVQIVNNGSGPFIAEWRLPEQQPTPAEIAAATPAAQAAFDAAEAAREQARLDRQELKAQFNTDKAKLDAAIDGITNATTLGELRGFVKDMAQVERRLLRSVKALVL